jgi:hypothetical protein
MSLICQNHCYDIEPLLVASSTNAVWLKCSLCGKLNIRLKQAACGSVIYRNNPGGAPGPFAVVECSGTIEMGPGHPEAPKSELFVA